MCNLVYKTTTMLYDGLESAIKDENLLLAIYYEEGKKITLFIPIAMLCGTDIIM